MTPILGSAIALRLFLFMVPTIAMSVALIVLVVGPDGLDALLRQASVTGELAQEVNTSTDTSTSTLIVAIATSAWLAAWAGRNLLVVLAACSGTAWRLDVLNSVIFERLGSVSVALFSLPVIRRLPERFPVIVRWFDLPTHQGLAPASLISAAEGRPPERR